MSVLTDTKVAKLEQQMQEMQFQMSQIMAAMDAMVEMSRNSSNAVVEGDDTPPKARNGQIKKAHR